MRGPFPFGWTEAFEETEYRSEPGERNEQDQPRREDPAAVRALWRG